MVMNDHSDDVVPHSIKALAEERTEVPATMTVYCDNAECPHNSNYCIPGKDRLASSFCRVKELRLEKAWEGSERTWRLRCVCGGSQ